MATAYFFDKKGNSIAPSVADATALTLVRGDFLGADQAVFTKNGTFAFWKCQLDSANFVIGSSVATARACRGVCIPKNFNSKDPSPFSGNVILVTTRANS